MVWKSVQYCSRNILHVYSIATDGFVDVIVLDIHRVTLLQTVLLLIVKKNMLEDFT